MKDLYIKPEVELKKFDILDVITGSNDPTEKPGNPDGSSIDGDWTGLY